MTKKLNTSKYVRASDMMKGATKCTISDEIKSKTVEQQNKDVINPYILMQQTVWSKLADKVVGADF